jgi:cobalt-precorrin-5B (C1)-methyltransferase
LGLKSKDLRTGYTTGACAAAAAKAATLAAKGGKIGPNDMIDIPFPDGSRHGLPVSRVGSDGLPNGALASVIKDAGDDPDVTNGAEIIAKVVFSGSEDRKSSDVASSSIEQPSLPVITIEGGHGVGRVTKPGLSVAVGEAAINPVPRRMIRDAVAEVVQGSGDSGQRLPRKIEVTISVPNGETIARKTLNSRLGVIGGISILGTTGIVRPLSAEAWTATISASMSVARAAGLDEIVLSSGRSSEKAHMTRFGLPEESYIMMGDYIEFSLREATKFGFSKIHFVAQWAKMLKAAMAIPQTHVRHGAIDLARTVAFLTSLGCPGLSDRTFNTAREILDLVASSADPSCRSLLGRVCSAAKAYAQSIVGNMPVAVYLISFSGEVTAHDG